MKKETPKTIKMSELYEELKDRGKEMIEYIIYLYEKQENVKLDYEIVNKENNERT